MIFRKLGTTGLSTSVISLGTWQFGGEWGVDFTQGQVDDIIDTAEESGINMLDTAECYGNHLSEQFIGDYLSRRDRSKWIIATKFGHHFHAFLSRTDQFNTDDVLKQLDTSLKALDTDYIDLYQFHSGPDDAFHNDALWTCLDKAKQAGKILHIGASLNKSTLIQAEEAAHYGIEVIQVQYNRLDRTAEERHFGAAQRDHLGVIARVPLASGLLSGKYLPGHRFAADDVRSRTKANELDRQLEEVQRILKEEVPAGVHASQWAFAWCLKNPIVTTVIPGCKDSAQVKDNAAAISLIDT
ncbi:MAG: aldo/keto reductase [Saprospiraceae bacterium]|nr:MAG: aldo/keto reductase [Bacteroidetes bacterium OLB9]MCO6464810.1 aldo/keto reductase [Saprospiraceae bacterium]MCZ2339143.1 aldo/keto reductase [Chitinophagales bacterium]